MKLFRDISVLQQVERMVNEGALGREVDLYAFYKQSDASDACDIRIFTDAVKCYEAMFELSLRGVRVSDAVCLMHVAKGDVDAGELERELIALLEKEQAVPFLRGGRSSKTIVANWDCADRVEKASPGEFVSVRNLHGFAWKEGDNLRAYSNPFLPQAWRIWREKQNEGLRTSLLVRKQFAVSPRQLGACRASFEAEMVERYSTQDSFVL